MLSFLSTLRDKVEMKAKGLSRDALCVFAAHVLLVIFIGIFGKCTSRPSSFGLPFGHGGIGVMRVRAVNLGGGSRVARDRILPKSVALRRGAGNAMQQSKSVKQTDKTVQTKLNVLNKHLSRYKDDKKLKSNVSQAQKAIKSTSKDKASKVVSVSKNEKTATTEKLMNSNQAVISKKNSIRGEIIAPSETELMNGSGAMFSWSGISGMAAGSKEGLIGIVEEYQQEIMQAVSYYWERPEGLSINEYCCYIVDLAMDGHIVNLKLERNSGNQRLNDSAKAAIVASDPLPLPSDSDLYKQFKQLRLIFRGDGLLGGGN